MATVAVVRAQPVAPPVEKIVLELTPEEATELAGYLGTNTGESRTFTIFYPLDEALAKAGLRAQQEAAYGRIKAARQSRNC